MSIRTLPDKMLRADFPTTYMGENVPGYGFMRAWGEGVPTDDETGYAPGCLYSNLSATGETDVLFVNIGDADASNWNAATVAGD